ncbi:hypothetical protein [Rheinheimera baltica]|uniref:hypothetical protein n=1 Tax=Rheinheimera baltica TaxID=67576 RepID=UPI0003FDF1A4|nr:hypothetical protein [Rheinheimera baltica]
MSRKNWNQVIPRSLTESLQLTKDFACATKQLSVPRIADRMGCSTDSLYKYLGGATMPTNLLIPFMETCHRVYPIQYMAHSLNMMLVPMPRGRKAEHKELVKLNMFCGEVMGKLLALHSGECSQQDAIDHLTLLIENLAYHRAEAGKLQQPELELFV